MALNECVCQAGRELRLQCTAVGTGITVWTGTAFDCRTNNEIVLHHSQFESGVVGECNNGMIIGRNLYRTFDGLNSTFTSQLTVHLPLPNATGNTLKGKAVQCIYDDDLREMSIGTYTIAYTREGTCIYTL